LSVVGTAVLIVMLTGCRNSTIVAAQQPTPVVIIRTYTGPDNQTHAEEISIKLNPRIGQFDGKLQDSDIFKVESLKFYRESPGYMNDWHPANGRQYLFTISGKGEIELIGGQKIRLEPGRILLAEDVTGKGHITRTVGSEDWVSVHVYLPER
jgi:hypothetical protein